MRSAPPAGSLVRPAALQPDFRMAALLLTPGMRGCQQLWDQLPCPESLLHCVALRCACCLQVTRP
jgi:hypothetical protein